MRLSTFSTGKFLVFGAFLIFGGCLSISLGIPSATPINGSYPYGNLGYGIWGGLIYIIAGLANITAACRTTPNNVIVGVVLNLVCCVMAVLQLALGIAAANQDFNAMWLRNLMENDITLAAEYKSFYDQFFPMTSRIAESRHLVPSLHNGVVAVDSLLAVAGFMVAVVAAVAASNGAVVVCCPALMTDEDAVSVIDMKKRVRV